MKGVKILELTPRKQAVLKAIVKAYIETGEPVGSKILTELIENAPSSATLRNEMSELCDLGFLEQPHTSAGRIPTSRGFQFYVKKLMPAGEISESDKAYIDNALENTDGPVFVNIHFGFENTFFETGVDSFNSAKFTDAGDAIIAEIKANPRVIAFSGHTHYPVQDPRNIYQEKGGFTAVETAHISGGNPFGGYPNIDINPERVEENFISQCLVVEVNKTTNAVLHHIKYLHYHKHCCTIHCFFNGCIIFFVNSPLFNIPLGSRI